MQFNPLTSEIIIEFLQKKLYLSEYRTLSLQEEMIIKGIIDQHSYEKIAHQIYLSPGTTRNIASQLFRHLSTLFKKFEGLFCHNSLKLFRIIFKILQTTVKTLSRPKDNLVIPMYNDISHPSFFVKVKILNRMIIQPLHFEQKKVKKKVFFL